jgi:hypothetical protein
MSATGPWQKSLDAPHMSAFGAKAESLFAAHMSAYDGYLPVHWFEPQPRLELWKKQCDAVS